MTDSTTYFDWFTVAWAGGFVNVSEGGQVVGNWNSTVGECINNTLTNVTGATDKIGKIESNCVAGLVQD